MRKITKFFSICCLCIMSVIIFAGCGTITYTYSVGKNGSMEESFDIKLNANTLTTQGIDIVDTMTKIDEIVNSWWNTFNTNESLSESVILKYDSPTPTQRIIRIQFATSEAYQTFYNIPPSTSSDITNNIIPSTFCDKLVICDQPMNLNNFAPLSIYTELVSYLADKYYAGEVTPVLTLLDKLTTNIVFLYPAHYMVHSNADHVERNGIYSAHLWNTNLATLLSTDENNQKHMYIYRNYYSAQNITNWYLLALVLTVAFGIIVAIIIITKNRKKSVTQNTTINETQTIETQKDD